MSWSLDLKYCRQKGHRNTTCCFWYSCGYADRYHTGISHSPSTTVRNCEPLLAVLQMSTRTRAPAQAQEQTQKHAQKHTRVQTQTQCGQSGVSTSFTHSLTRSLARPHTLSLSRVRRRVHDFTHARLFPAWKEKRMHRACAVSDSDDTTRHSTTV